MPNRQQAEAQGFTRQVSLELGHYSLDVLVRPDVDFDDRFRAFCLAENEYLNINGWLIENITGIAA